MIGLFLCRRALSDDKCEKLLHIIIKKKKMT